MIKLDVDASSFVRSMHVLRDRLDSACTDAVIEACRHGVRVAKDAPWKDRTGETRRKIRIVSFSRGPKGAEGEFESGAKHSIFLEKGTKAHNIWPKAKYRAPTKSLKANQTRRASGKGPHEYIVGRGIALRWDDPERGIVFAKHVWHPGSRPYVFMSTAELAARQMLMTKLRSAVKRLCR